MDSLASEGALVDFTRGPLVYVRWKVMANLTSAEPGAKGTLLLESLVLPVETPMENLAPAKRTALGKASATTFVLW